MRRALASLPALLAAAVLGLAACGASGAAAPAVPSLGAVTGTTIGGQSQGKAAQVHTAAECIRHHGIPRYQQPVVTPGGQVYSGTRSIQDAPQSAQDSAVAVVGGVVTAAIVGTVAGAYPAFAQPG